jgi:hypothetical protein
VLYFRVLKQTVGRPVLLPVVLEGLAKIAHLINLETVQDVIEGTPDPSCIDTLQPRLLRSPRGRVCNPQSPDPLGTPMPLQCFVTCWTPRRPITRPRRRPAPAPACRSTRALTACSRPCAHCRGPGGSSSRTIGPSSSSSTDR